MTFNIRYYPLICIDTDGIEFTAMTPTDSEKTVRDNHRMWLSEFALNHYRLGASVRPSASAVKTLSLHCPKCGSILKNVTAVTDDHTFPLYACKKCSVQR